MIGQTFQSYRNVPATMAGTSTTSLPTPPLWKQMASASGQRAAIKNWLPFQKKTLKKLCATQHRNPQRRNLFVALLPEMQDDMRRLVPVLTDFYQQFSEVIR